MTSCTDTEAFGFAIEHCDRDNWMVQARDNDRCDPSLHVARVVGDDGGIGVIVNEGEGGGWSARGQQVWPPAPAGPVRDTPIEALADVVRQAHALGLITGR